MIAISVPIGDRGTVFLIDLLVGKVFGGSSVPGQDQCLGSIAPGRSQPKLLLLLKGSTLSLWYP